MALISVSIPVYNNQGSLAITFDRLKKVFSEEIKQHELEVIFVNDGSKDRSWDELKKIKESNPSYVRLIRFTKNFGQNPAIMAGLRHSRGDCVINISADLQDPIELIPKMIREWETGYKIVACVREGREDAWFRRVPSLILYSFIHLSVPHYPVKGFDYFLLGREVLSVVGGYKERHSFIVFNILETGYEPSYIPYTRQKRVHGRSGYTFFKLLKAAIDNIVNASYLPIRFMTLIGIFTALASFVYACSVSYSRLAHHITIPGYTPVVILILFFSGLNMLMLGLIGEYLWRTYDQTKARPEYFILEKID